jgi:hypothetical protein
MGGDQVLVGAPSAELRAMALGCGVAWFANTQRQGSQTCFLRPVLEASADSSLEQPIVSDDVLPHASGGIVSGGGCQRSGV